MVKEKCDNLFLKMEYFVKVSSRMTNDNYISNLKVVIVFQFTFESYCHFAEYRGRRE